MKKIYLAGGWFTPEQKEIHDIISTKLGVISVKYDIEIFNPRFDSPQMNLNKCLQSNIDNIKNCDLVVAIIEPKDTGTIWECGFAYSIKKPILFYTNKKGKVNLMLAKTGKYCDDYSLLEEIIKNKKTWIFQEITNDYKGEIE